MLNRNCARHGSGGGVTWARPSGTKGHERQETVVLCAGCRNFRVLWPFVFPFTRRASERASEQSRRHSSQGGANLNFGRLEENRGEKFRNGVERRTSGWRAP